MANGLYNDFNQPSGNNPIQAFQEFKRTFRGDARAKVQELLNSGQMSQMQYNQLQQMASQIFLKK